MQFALCSIHVSLTKRCEFNFFGAWWQFLKSCLLIFKLISQWKVFSIVRKLTEISSQVVAMRSLILQVVAILSVQALENPIPSSFLQPRDFNPHPYEVGVNRLLFTPAQYDDYQGLGLAQKYQELSRKIQKFVFHLSAITRTHFKLLFAARVQYNFLRITTARPRVNRKNSSWNNKGELCHTSLTNKHWYHIRTSDWHWTTDHNSFTDSLET